MHIIREHKEEDPGRICHITHLSGLEVSVPQDDALVGIDEDFLAWLYIAPGYEESERGRQFLDLARQLLGSHAWAVVTIATAGPGEDEDVLETVGLEVVESYKNTAPASAGVSVHLARTV
jgi:hypothetical protein